MQYVFTLFNVTNVAFVIENGMTTASERGMTITESLAYRWLHILAIFTYIHI